MATVRRHGPVDTLAVGPALLELTIRSGGRAYDLVDYLSLNRVAGLLILLTTLLVTGVAWHARGHLREHGVPAGRSRWPERFPLDKLERQRRHTGAAKFQSQIEVLGG